MEDGTATVTLLSSQRRQVAHQLFWRGTTEMEPVRTLHCDVLVIGAGPAGLTSAWLMQQEGYEVIVVDNETLVGGAARQFVWHNVHIPCGAVYFADLSGVLAEVLSCLALRPLPLPDDALWLAGTAYRSFWQDEVLNELPIPQEERRAFYRFRTDLLAAPPFPWPLPESLPAFWQRLAACPAEAVVKAYGSAHLERLLNAYARSVLGGSLAEVSALCLQEFYASELGQAFHRTRYSLRGGIARFCESLCDRIGTEYIRSGWLAFRSEHIRATRVRTLCLTEEGTVGAIESSVVIFAGPKYVAKHLLPELPPAQQQALLRLRYAPYVLVYLHTPFRLLPENSFDLWVPEARLFTDITDVGLLQAQPTDGFLYCIYAPLSPRQRALLLEEEHVHHLVTAIAREALQLLAPDALHSITELAAFVWGHGLVIPTPEAFCGVAQQARRPVGRIVFANTDNEAAPALENAIEHAVRAAELAHSLLRAHSKGGTMRPAPQMLTAPIPGHADPVQSMD